MSDQLVGALRGFLILAVLAGALLGIAALIDAFRNRRSQGRPRPPKKLTRREAFWIILIVILLVLLGFPVKNAIKPFRSQPANTK